MSHLAALALERGCGRLEWAVLSWNEPAIAFYEEARRARGRRLAPAPARRRRARACGAPVRLGSVSAGACRDPNHPTGSPPAIAGSRVAAPSHQRPVSSLECPREAHDLLDAGRAVGVAHRVGQQAGNEFDPLGGALDAPCRRDWDPARRRACCRPCRSPSTAASAALDVAAAAVAHVEPAAHPHAQDRAQVLVHVDVPAGVLAAGRLVVTADETCQLRRTASGPAPTTPRRWPAAATRCP